MRNPIRRENIFNFLIERLKRGNEGKKTESKKYIWAYSMF